MKRRRQAQRRIKNARKMLLEDPFLNDRDEGFQTWRDIGDGKFNQRDYTSALHAYQFVQNGRHRQELYPKIGL